MQEEQNLAQDTIRQIWIPILLGSSLVLLAVFLWQMLLAQERAYTQNVVAGQAQQVAGLIKGSLEERIPALTRMSKRWEMRGGIPRQEWEADARNFLQDHSDIQALEWVDSSFVVRWIVPMEGNEEAQGLNLGFESNRREALEVARDQRTVTITQPIELVQGGKGFLVYVPIFIEDEFQGFTVAVFRFQEWLNAILADVRTSHYSLQLFKNGEEIYARQKPAVQYQAEAAQEAEVSVQGLTWRVRSCPTPELIAQTTTWLPEVSLAGGLFFALLIGLTVRVSQTAASRAASIKRANQTLEKEIAERRHIEESLQLTQFTVDRTGDAVFWIGPDARILYVNDSACEGLGYTRDELVGMAICDIDPDWPQEVWVDYWPKLREQKVVHIETRHQRKDGTIFPVEVTANFLEYEGKEFDCATVRNISDRKEAESALRESEAWFKTISEAIPHLVWTADPDGALDYVNPRVLEYFDRSYDQMIEWNWTEVLHPDDLPVCLERWAQAREQGILYEMEFRLQRASDHSYRWFLARALPFKNQEGRIIKWFGTSTDISDRKLAEEVLRQAHDELEERVTARTAELVSANANLAAEIADRKRAEERLEETHALLMAAIESSPAGIIIADAPDGNIRVANSAALGICGTTKEYLTDIPITDHPKNWQTFYPDGTPYVPQELPLSRAILLGERTKNVEVIIRRQTGEDRWVLGNAAPVFNTKGDITAGVVVFPDITERKQAEELLRQSQERLKAVLDHSPSLIFIKDLQGRYLHANPEFERVFHLEENQVFGKTDEELFSPKQAAQFRKNDDLVIQRQAPLEFEEVAEHEDGPHTSVVSKFPLFDEKGEIHGICGITLDITERTRAEVALRESEKRYELAARATFNAIWDWDLVTNGVTWNEGVESLFGYAPDAVGPDAIWWKEHIHPEDKDKVVSGIHAVIDSDQTNWLDEYRYRCSDETYALVVDRGYVVRDEKGKAIRMVGAMDDITNQKRLEKDILTLNTSLEERVQQRTAELEMKNAELERFTYAVSHDLKSPLVTIQGFLKMLEEDAHAGRTTRLTADIQRIDGAAQKMQQLLNEVLELSRIGHIVNPPEPVAMEQVIRDAVEQVSGQLAACNIGLAIAADLPVVLGDRPRLVEAVQNLVGNAIKFMGEQPEPRIEISVRQDGEETVMCVCDNGIGIEPQYLEKIFGLFERLDSQAEGTGIGLALVKRILEVQGGRIWVESEGLGRGSTMCFTLPCEGIRASKSQGG